MKSPLKTMTAKQLLEFLPTYKGTPLSSFSKLPLFFSSQEDSGNISLRRELVYKDFQEAWVHLTLIATSCKRLGYTPTIFNVYNKVVVECFTINEEGNKCVTTKDLFMAYFLNEIEGNQGEVAYRRALDDFRTAI